MNKIENTECVPIGIIEMKNVGKREKGITRKNYGKPGIYKIINKVNGKYYVGSSRNLLNRVRRHKQGLNKNTHSNGHLQRAWNKYGNDAFVFAIMEIIPNITNDDLLLIEQKHLDIAKSEQDICYNISFIANGVYEMILDKKESMIKNLMLRHDNKTYTFINTQNGDACVGTKYDLRTQFKLPSYIINNLIKNGYIKRGKHKMWVKYDVR